MVTTPPLPTPSRDSSSTGGVRVRWARPPAGWLSNRSRWQRVPTATRRSTASSLRAILGQVGRVLCRYTYVGTVGTFGTLEEPSVTVMRVSPWVTHERLDDD